MHELSLCQGLLQQVTELASQHGEKSVRRITLRIGPLAGVEIPLLENAFLIARRNSLASEAELEVESVPLRVHCSACGGEQAVELPDLRCPGCHSNRTSLVSGDELLLVSVGFGP